MRAAAQKFRIDITAHRSLNSVGCYSDYLWDGLCWGGKRKHFCNNILTDALVIMKTEILMLLRSALAWAKGQDLSLNLGRNMISV